VLAAKAASMACIAVPEQGEEHQPAFGLADAVVGSLVEVDEARLDAVAAHFFRPMGAGEDS
jgi:beta-phosphoglucomutase-like phosphatase (HAD superfamily)